MNHEIPDWITTAVKLHDEGKVDAAIDVIYGALDEILWDYQTSPFTLHNLKKALNGVPDNAPKKEGAEEINNIISQPYILDLPVDLLLSIITVTRTARHHLPARKELCTKARVVFDSKGENGEELLRYLDIP